MHYTLCDYILDIVQNAIEAGSSDTELTIHETPSSLLVTVADTGRGMDAGELEKAKDPFYTDGKKHPGRRVGLGLPFLIQASVADGRRVANGIAYAIRARDDRLFPVQPGPR